MTLFLLWALTLLGWAIAGLTKLHSVQMDQQPSGKQMGEEVRDGGILYGDTRHNGSVGDFVRSGLPLMGMNFLVMTFANCYLQNMN